MAHWDRAELPRHVAVVMDGNGRWANQRGLPRTDGHKAGIDALVEVVDGALEADLEWLSTYAFSTENWKRSTGEVFFLMKSGRDVMRDWIGKLNDNNVRVRWAGRPGRLWKSVVDQLKEAERVTAGNTGLNLTMCVNYGGRAELVDAMRSIAQDVAAGRVDPNKIDEKLIAENLYIPEMPDVDLFLRTSGELRTSNFLMWESAYAEYVFVDELWPDFTKEHLFSAIDQYVNRDRRYGGATDGVASTPGEAVKNETAEITLEGSDPQELVAESELS